MSIFFEPWNKRKRWYSGTTESRCLICSSQVVILSLVLQLRKLKMADDPLSDEELDEVYRRMIDLFIDRANQFAETNSQENVGLALLYAAARFNAHVVSQHANTLEDYEKDLPRARQFFCGQYQQMLDENLEDYKSVYTRYANFMKKQ